MANITLKNANGEEVEYNSVKQIAVNDYKFTRLNEMNVYLLRGENSNYMVTGKVNSLSIFGDKGFFCEVSENDCKNFGYEAETKYDGAVISTEYRVMIIFTTKTLTIGETYALADIC